MKRANALADLSREHHTALVWALRATRAAGVDHRAAVEVMSALVAIFERELEPHFKVEEAGLLPALQAAGEVALVERTLAEHRQLRATMRRIVAGDAAALAVFGKALQAHVRFEERELFPLAEQRLAPARLAALMEEGST